MRRERILPGPEDVVRAQHMLSLAHEAIAQFADVSESEFARRRLFQTSLAWYLQGIGEAARRVSDESRALIPAIPWRQVVGTRHIISHEYDRLMPEKLWRVLQVHLPSLVANLQANIHLLAGKLASP